MVDDLFIRPLIDVRRKDLLAYLRQHRLRYRIDATNRDTRLTRNRIRRRLLPLLERQFNPAATEALAHAADLLRDEDAFLDGVAERRLAALASQRKDGLVLGREGLLGLPAALQRRILRLALATVRGDLRRITLGHVEQTLRLLRDPHGRRTATLPDGLLIGVDGTGLRITTRRGARGAARPAPDAGPCREALCPVPGEVALQGFDLRLRATVLGPEETAADLKRGGATRAYLDADLLPGPLLIRPRRPGDRFVPLGGPGTRKVKSFLIDRKVPVDDRGRIPLVLSGDRIAWVVGHAIDDRFKVTPRTRRVLLLEKEPR